MFLRDAQTMNVSRSQTNTPCINGLFHGNSTGLEVASAKALFTKNRNDRDCPFKFSIYAGDGDSAVGKEVLKDPDVKKLECQWHFRRDCKGKLVVCFHNSVAIFPKKK